MFFEAKSKAIVLAWKLFSLLIKGREPFPCKIFVIFSDDGKLIKVAIQVDNPKEMFQKSAQVYNTNIFSTAQRYRKLRCGRWGGMGQLCEFVFQRNTMFGKALSRLAI